MLYDGNWQILSIIRLYLYYPDFVVSYEITEYDRAVSADHVLTVVHRRFVEFYKLQSKRDKVELRPAAPRKRTGPVK